MSADDLGEGVKDPRLQPLAEYAKLARKIDAMAKVHGLYLQGISVIPPYDDESPVMIQASFAVGDPQVAEGIPSSDPELESQFKDIILGAQEAEREATMRDLRSEFERDEKDMRKEDRD